MNTKSTEKGMEFSVYALNMLIETRNAKPSKPDEIQEPKKYPDTIPAEEPDPDVWPKKAPEIEPGKEPFTIPPSAPPEVPAPPQI